MVGAALYNFTYFLIAQPGSYFVAILLLISGAILFSNIEGYQLVNSLQVMGERMQELLEGDPAKQAKKQAAKEERQKQRAKAREEKKLAAKEAAEAEIAELEKRRSAEQQAKSAPSYEKIADDEPEQLSFVPIDSFQGTVPSATMDMPKAEPTVTTPTAYEPLEAESLEDDGTALEFEI